MLPNTNAVDTAEERYERCVRWYNVSVTRYNAALDAYEAADREIRDAEQWLDEARDDLNRAATAVGLSGHHEPAGQTSWTSPDRADLMEPPRIGAPMGPAGHGRRPPAGRPWTPAP